MASDRRAGRSRSWPIVLLGLALLCFAAASALLDTADSAPAPAFGGERVTILLLGIDQREVEAGPWRTDTMVVLTIDPATESAGMLSIPRDLWVTISGYEVEGKINTAHFIGDAQDYPGGGPALAVATVQRTFDIPVQYYVRLNFTAFERIIDLIGGVAMCVDQPIDDPLYPDSAFGYEPLYIPAGCQNMDGRLALKYARARHTPLGDFDRARRQQQVILAVRDKLTQAEMLPTLIGQAGALLDALGDSLQTNLSPEQLIELARLGATIDPANIQALTIEPSMTLAFRAPTDPPQDALLPIAAEMRKMRDRLLNVDATLASDSEVPAPPSIVHLVQPGDTLFSLAERYHTSVQAIMDANGLTEFDIQAGQQLLIPLP
jgi:LCP family protein required for cell wall assembly